MPKTIAITPSWFWPESIARVAGIPPFGVSELCVDRHAREKPDAPAIQSSRGTLTFRELQERVFSLSARLATHPPGSRAVLDGSLTTDNVIRLLAALRCRLHTRVVPPDEDPVNVGQLFNAAVDLGAQDTSNQGFDGLDTDIPDPASLRVPVLAIPGDATVVNHSHRSLLASIISVVTFLQPDTGRAWLATLPLDRWEGLNAALTPLYLGVPLVLDEQSAGFADTVQQYQPGYAFDDLGQVTLVTREEKRAVKKARGILDAILLSTNGLFSPGDRQRVAKSFQTSSLTMFGRPETGAIFAAHPQWYLDESVGIPITNAHVVPSDPRNGTPIQALWELVESAEVTVKGPALMCGYEGGDNENHFVGGRFRTRVIASSDANGMIYILPD